MVQKLRQHGLGKLSFALGVSLLLVATGQAQQAAAVPVMDYIQQPVSSTAYGVFSVDAFDIDGDGQVDILGAMRTSGNVAWWHNGLAEGTGWQEQAVDRTVTGAQNATAADIDADGDLDVVAAAAIADEIAWWRNEDGSGHVWTKTVVGQDFDGARWVISADMDADGDLDIAGVAGWANRVAWWQNSDGSGAKWSEHEVDSAFGGAHSLAACDLDSDGDLDLLGAAFWDNEIGWWENLDNRGLTWAYHLIAAGFWNAISAEAGDIDRDGDLDVVGAAFGAGDVGWWQNRDGKGLTWVYRALDINFVGAHNIVLVDMDNDKDLDIVSPASGGDQIAWWDNILGSGRRWNKKIVASNFDGPVNLAVADFNADGLMDVTAAGFVGDTIAWWQAQP